MTNVPLEDLTDKVDSKYRLVIVAAKTPALADHIAAVFLSAMVPGRSVLIHQDFLHAGLPWLPVQIIRILSRGK